MNTKATVCIFLLLIGGLGLINLFTPVRQFSENENRALQQMPVLTADTLKDASFTRDFDRFVTDQFAFRDGWVGVKAQSEKALLKRSSNGVYFARDGYLIEMFDTADLVRYEKNLGYTEQFIRRAQDELGVPVSTMLVPTASLILRDKLPAHTPEVDQAAMLEQAAKTLPGFVDVSHALTAHRDEYIYYRTDHHWTSQGAARAYEDWRRQTGREAPPPDSYTQELLSDEFYGTTYSKASLYSASPDVITAMLPPDLGPYSVDYQNGGPHADTMYDRSYLDVKDKYSVFLSANQPLVRITTSNRGGEKLVIVKDSYANAFVQMALADYEEIYVVDLRYYKLSVHDLIEQNGITEALLLYNLKGFAGDVNLYFLTI